MKLFEYEAKEIAAGFGFPMPKGMVVSTPEEAKEAFKSIGGPVVVKSQVLVAGRGKAGGIKFASTQEEAYEAAKSLLGSEIKGEKVVKVLMEGKVAKERELYLGVVVNRQAGCYTILGSTEGGVDIEEVSLRAPQKIVKFDVDPVRGVYEYEAREFARKMGFAGKHLVNFSKAVMRLFKITVECDGELVETNPLMQTPEGDFVAADFKILVDDNSIYRHPNLQLRAKKILGELTPLEAKAREKKLAYVDLDGDIGVIGNGAGLVMATVDMIKYFGGEPANFCDLGGGADYERVSAAIEVVLSNPKVKVLLINVLGGITRCDDIAKGILEVKTEKGIEKPLVVRLVGTNDVEGRRILSDAGVSSLDSMEEAVQKAVQIARG